VVLGPDCLVVLVQPHPNGMADAECPDIPSSAAEHLGHIEVVDEGLGKPWGCATPAQGILRVVDPYLRFLPRFSAGLDVAKKGRGVSVEKVAYDQNIMESKRP
jgi:hypothetical protein